MARLTEVVKNLLIINVIVFFAVKYLWPFPGIDRYFMLVTPGQQFVDGDIIYKFEPVQIITHMFMHGDEKHLLFNMFGLFLLGPWVEAGLGHKRFLVLYLTSGVVASALQLFVTKGIVLGASGAVFGVLAAFATMYPNVEMMLLFPPIPIKAKYLALILLGLGLYSGVSNSEPGIGHFAHVGGAVMGFILVRYWGMHNLR